jgi:hypothetical protein
MFEQRFLYRRPRIFREGISKPLRGSRLRRDCVASRIEILTYLRVYSVFDLGDALPQNLIRGFKLLLINFVLSLILPVPEFISKMTDNALIIWLTDLNWVIGLPLDFLLFIGIQPCVQKKSDNKKLNESWRPICIFLVGHFRFIESDSRLLTKIWANNAFYSCFPS